MRTHSPHVRPSKSPSLSPSPSPSPRHTRSPSPSPSPSPTETAAIEAAVLKQANLDRPGEVKSVSDISFFSDTADCPQTGQAAQATARFTTAPKTGVYVFCKARTHWDWANGPIYPG